MKASKETLDSVLLKIKKEREDLPEINKLGDNNWEVLDLAIRMISEAISGDFNPDKYKSYANEYVFIGEILYWFERGDDFSYFAKYY